MPDNTVVTVDIFGVVLLGKPPNDSATSRNTAPTW